MSGTPVITRAAEPPVGAAPRCQRCGFELRETRPTGCKSPCSNCGTVYPLGDCSD